MGMLLTIIRIDLVDMGRHMVQGTDYKRECKTGRTGKCREEECKCNATIRVGCNTEVDHLYPKVICLAP